MTFKFKVENRYFYNSEVDFRFVRVYKTVMSVLKEKSAEVSSVYIRLLEQTG